MRGGGGRVIDLAVEQRIGRKRDVTFTCIKALILDWAGTTVDFGSRAPVGALQRAFEEAGVPILAAEARAHMGTLKKDQIRSICAGERVRTEWTARHGQPPTERDVERIFEDFIPKQAEVLAEYSAPIPGVPETVDAWRSAGLRIGSTTGYTRALLDVVIPPAAKLGYAPDASVTPDEVGGGRPKTFHVLPQRHLTGSVSAVALRQDRRYAGGYLGRAERRNVDDRVDGYRQ